MIHVLLGLAIFGLVTSTVFTGLVVVGARHHLRNSSRAVDAAYVPALSLLKPLHGSEPGLEGNLATFFNQDYPRDSFEILFCARDEENAGLRAVRRVAAQYPDVTARFLWTNDLPPYINAKVASLEKMTDAAAHEILVISDSDVRVTTNYLRSIASPFAEEHVGAMTCLYRGVAAEGGLWARIEAVGMSVEMSAGVLVANWMEGMQFVLGPTMAVRASCVQAMGGMGILGDYCSDDYLVGNYVFKQGRAIALSNHVIDHMVINASFADSIRHQVRWMKSTRYSRPKGHFGTALTFSMPFALLALASALALRRPILGCALFASGVVTRWIIAWAVGERVVHDPNRVSLYLLYPLRDLMGFGFWFASYLSSKISWRGKVYRLLPGGRMQQVD